MKKYSYVERQRERQMRRLMKPLREAQWKYRNLMLLLVSLLIAYFMLRTAYLESLISSIGNFGIFGPFFAGMLYPFSLSVAPSMAIFYALSKKYSPITIGLIGAVGTVIGDYAIFKFAKEKLAKEIRLLLGQINSKTSYIFENSIFYKLFPFSNLVLSKRFRIFMIKARRSKIWRAAIWVITGLMIASPLPDELGIALLGMTNQKTRKFIIFSFLCNFVGIVGILYFSTVV